MARKRRKLSESVETQVLLRSRRRCCICFGLNRDETLKAGQIAHLDQNPANGEADNLAWLCLDHHDKYDGKTSQSKGLTIAEVKRHRDELYSHFQSWMSEPFRHGFMNFLASTMTLDQLVEGAVAAAKKLSWMSEPHLTWALTESQIDLFDGDLIAPLIDLLQEMQWWGWLTFEMGPLPNGRTNFIIKHEPICAKVAARLKERGLDVPEPVKSLTKKGDSKASPTTP